MIKTDVDGVSQVSRGVLVINNDKSTYEVERNKAVKIKLLEERVLSLEARMIKLESLLLKDN